MGGRWSWAGAVALVLAVCVGVGWAAAVIIAAIHDEPLGPEAGTFLTSTGGALVGGVVGWLGATTFRRTRTGGGRHERAPEGTTAASERFPDAP